MKLDKGYVIDLCLGQPRLPEAGDSQVTIPPTVVPVLLGVLPLQGVQASTPLTESGMTLNRTVQAPASGLSQVIMATLPQGLWELEFNVSYIADFKQVLTGADLGVRLNLIYLGGATSLIEAYVDTVSFFAYGRCRILTKATSQIRHDVQATGAGQNILASAWINCIRVI